MLSLWMMDVAIKFKNLAVSMIYFQVIITVVISMVTFNLVSVVVVVLVQVTLIHRQVQPALKVQRV